MRLVPCGRKKAAARKPATSTRPKELSTVYAIRWRCANCACSHVFSLEHILLLNSTGTVIDEQRAGTDQHKNENTNGRRQSVVMLINCQLVQPGDQQVCFTSLVIIKTGRAASCEQVNDIEIIDVTTYVKISGIGEPNFETGDGICISGCDKNHIW